MAGHAVAEPNAVRTNKQASGSVNWKVATRTPGTTAADPTINADTRKASLTTGATSARRDPNGVNAVTITTLISITFHTRRIRNII